MDGIYMVKVGDKFPCYSLKFSKYLKEQGYVGREKYNSKENKYYYIYIVDERFIRILEEWKRNKDEGFKIKFVEKL